MSSQSTNLKLIKPAGGENLSRSDYNDNLDTIDNALGSGFGLSNASSVNAEINALGDALAIIANGNTHAAISSGQFVYVRKHSTLADGLYVASSNISANATLSDSNLDADSSGGLNALSSNIQTINNKWVNQGSSTTPVTNLDNLPINAQGYAILDASISPTGAQQAFSYIKWGANAGNRYYVLAVRVSTSTNAMYYCIVYDGSNKGWKQLALNSDFSIEDKKITRPTGTTYFTERDAFKARRVGNTIAIFSYVNITTQVPANTAFADTGFSSAEGMYIFMEADGSKATMVTCSGGILKPSDSTLATGYYYVSGCAISPL